MDPYYRPTDHIEGVPGGLLRERESKDKFVYKKRRSVGRGVTELERIISSQNRATYTEKKREAKVREGNVKQ